MDINAFKELLKEADQESVIAHENYSNRSAAHKAALQIIQFEKEIYYGDTMQSHHIKKIKNIIEVNAEDIINENKKS